MARLSNSPAADFLSTLKSMPWRPILIPLGILELAAIASMTSPALAFFAFIFLVLGLVWGWRVLGTQKEPNPPTVQTMEGEPSLVSSPAPTGNTGSFIHGTNYAPTAQGPQLGTAPGAPAGARATLPRWGWLFRGRDQAELESYRPYASLIQEAREQGILDIAQRREELLRDIDRLEESRRRAQGEHDNALLEAQRTREVLEDYRLDLEAGEACIYDFQNPADDSVRLKGQLEDVRLAYKELISQKRAIQAPTTYTLDGSQQRGRAFVRDFGKLLLRAYNAEAENCIKAVKAGHLEGAQKRLRKSAEMANKLGAIVQISITPEYTNLRLRELSITHEHLAAVREEREQEREARARAKEEERAQMEYQRAKDKQAQEVQRIVAALESLRERGDNQGAIELEEKLEVAEGALQDIQERMTQTRVGHVYVISNPGAFGQGIVKIGMTRRLDPEDRVRELGSASVPFYFDQHAMIFSSDAVALERRLHDHFRDRRVNLVNTRREYFYATPQEVKEALLLVGDKDGHVLEFKEESEAKEYRDSEALRRERGIQLPQEILDLCALEQRAPGTRLATPHGDRTTRRPNGIADYLGMGGAK